MVLTIANKVTHVEISAISSFLDVSLCVSPDTVIQNSRFIMGAYPS